MTFAEARGRARSESGRRVGSRAPRREPRRSRRTGHGDGGGGGGGDTSRERRGHRGSSRAARVRGRVRSRPRRAESQIGRPRDRAGARSRRRLWNPSFAKHWRVADPGAARGRARVVPSRVWTRAAAGGSGRRSLATRDAKMSRPGDARGRRRARRAIRRVRDGTRVPRRFRPTNRPRRFSRRDRSKRRASSRLVDGVRRAREKLVRTSPRADAASVPASITRRRHRRARDGEDAPAHPAGWSEAKQLARAFDPAGSGTVSRASFRDARAARRLGFRLGRRRRRRVRAVGGDAFASTDEVPTAAFVRRALPPSYAERPARADVLRELRDAGAADERDARAVLSSCGVEMDEGAARGSFARARGRRAKDRTWCASPPPSPRRNRARGDPSPRRPPSITASRRRGTRDRARRRLRKSRRRAPTTSRAMDQDGRRTEARASSPS